MVHEGLQNLDDARYNRSTHPILNDVPPACHCMEGLLKVELWKEGSDHEQGMIDVITWTCVV